MLKVLQIINYLKENNEIAKVIDKKFDFDFISILKNDYSEVPSNKKLEIENKFVELGLLEKESVKRKRSSTVRVDDVKSYYYNYDYKMKYLEEHRSYKEETKRILRVFFRKTAHLEKKFGKDLYDFNTLELAEVLRDAKASTVRSLQNYISMVGKYVDYAIAIKASNLKENLIYSFSAEEKASKLIDKESSQGLYLTRDEVMYIAKHSINAQDGVILALLYDGFSHKENFKELVNLKVEDIDWDSGIVTIEGRPEKNNKVKLSNETILLLKKAVGNDEYLSTKEDSDVIRKYKVKPTKYVLRGLRPKNEDSKIPWRNIHERILRQSEYFDKEFLTGTNIVVSSQVDTAYNLFIDDKDKGDRAIQMALEKWNFPYNKSSLFSLKKKVNMYKKVHIS